MNARRKEEFAALAVAALSPLYNAALRLTASDADAEDLVQETYAHAFAHADQLHDLGSIRAWLFRIMRNCSVSHYRAHRARPELTVIEGGAESIESSGEPVPDVQAEALARLSREAISRALAQLPEEFRSTIVMCDVEGFSYEEIAEAMECPIGTVRSRIARARAQLMRSLAGEAATLGIGARRRQ
jgi:RNA polymerase sigma-70 factor (ECF subfamily)